MPLPAETLAKSKSAAVLASQPPVLIDIDAFAALGSVGRTFAYELLKRPGAPTPVVLSAKVVRYVLADAVAFWQTIAAEAQASGVPSRRFRSGRPVGEVGQ